MHVLSLIRYPTGDMFGVAPRKPFRLATEGGLGANVLRRLSSVVTTRVCDHATSVFNLTLRAFSILDRNMKRNLPQ